MVAPETASRAVAGAIARAASGEDGAFYTLRSFAPPSAGAAWETFGGIVSGQGYRPLFVVSDHGVMRTASVLVRDGGGDSFETPKGPILPPKLGALARATAEQLDRDDRPTVLDAALAIFEVVHPLGVRLELLGRWEGTLGARFDRGSRGPLAFVWQRQDGLTVASASVAQSGRLVVPSVERGVASLAELELRVPEVVQAILSCTNLG